MTVQLSEDECSRLILQEIQKVKDHRQGYLKTMDASTSVHQRRFQGQPGDEVLKFDFDNNTKSRKGKLESFFRDKGTIKNITENGYVEVDEILSY